MTDEAGVVVHKGGDIGGTRIDASTKTVWFQALGKDGYLYVDSYIKGPVTISEGWTVKLERGQDMGPEARAKLAKWRAEA